MHKILFFLFPLFFLSCSKNLEDNDLLPAEVEVVNGITIKWQGSMTEKKRQLIRGILSDMVLVEGGIFTMGTSQVYDADARDNESPAHLVKLTNYYISAHELSYNKITQLFNVANNNIYRKNILYYTWDDWKYILNMLSTYTGLNFSFPTEAQWEFAARGGNQSKGYLYPGSNDWSQVWSEAVDETNTSIPNELGLYNMADKQGEWCLDAFSVYTNGVMETNPCILQGEDHVVRGGCFVSSGVDKNWFDFDFYEHDDKRICRSTSRSKNGQKSFYIGCRPVININ